MNNRIYNFSAGPAILPPPVLEKAQAELLSLNGIGMSVMEISHRSEQFEAILDGAKQGIRDLLNVPENYQILFLNYKILANFFSFLCPVIPSKAFAIIRVNIQRSKYKIRFFLTSFYKSIVKSRRHRVVFIFIGFGPTV